MPDTVRRLGADMALVSVVAPMHDEAPTVARFHERVAAALEGEDWELVVVDDGSRDATHAELTAIAAADERVRVIRLSRSFGHQAALTAGLEHARGDAVVMLDGDLHDPPELTPAMPAGGREGSEVVSGVREARAGERPLKRVTARWFYRLFRRLTDVDLVEESGDFRLMD